MAGVTRGAHGVESGGPGYTGPDRRSAAAPVLRHRLLGGAAAGGTCAVGLDVAVLAARAADPAQVAALAVVTWSAPLVVASALLLCAWRVGGRAAPAHWGTAAALAGGVGPGVAWVVAGASHPAGAPAVVTASVAAGILAAAPHARAALRGATVQADLRPALGVAAGACLVLAAGAGAAVLAGPGWSTWTPLPLLAGPAGPWAAALLGAVSGTALAGAADALRAALGTHRRRVLAVLSRLQRSSAEVTDDRLRRHDARSALAAVRAASAVLTGEVPAVGADPRGRAELAVAVREELSRVERLLGGPGPADDAAAAAAGRGPRPGVVDLREAAAPVVAAWRARGVDVQGPPPGEPAWGIGDVDDVRRVLGNLLANAERHAPGAAVRLALLPPDGGRVVLRVHDDGPGVPAVARDAVFAPGARLGGGDGEGLGLASARALAEADGGSLRVVDAGSGACFELRLPAAAASAAASAAAPAPAVPR